MNFIDVCKDLMEPIRCAVIQLAVPINEKFTGLIFQELLYRVTDHTTLEFYSHDMG